MSKPRPYGLGPYGAGLYERWGPWPVPIPPETGAWVPPGGCESGNWPILPPCETGVWAAPGGSESGNWLSAPPPGTGVWAPP